MLNHLNGLCLCGCACVHAHTHTCYTTAIQAGTPQYYHNLPNVIILNIHSYFWEALGIKKHPLLFGDLLAGGINQHTDTHIPWSKQHFLCFFHWPSCPQSIISYTCTSYIAHGVSESQIRQWLHKVYINYNTQPRPHRNTWNIQTWQYAEVCCAENP